MAVSQAGVAWLLASRPCWRPIIGVSSLEQVDSALAGAELELSPDDVAALDAVS